MERQATPRSRHVKSIGYTLNDGGTLEVEYENGKVYRYKGVPFERWKMLQEAESVGGFIRREIQGWYKVEKVEGGG